MHKAAAAFCACGRTRSHTCLSLGGGGLATPQSILLLMTLAIQLIDIEWAQLHCPIVYIHVKLLAPFQMTAYIHV